MPQVSPERLLIMLRHCDTRLAQAHPFHNEENMLIADSSAGGKIKESKQHLWCPLFIETMDKRDDKVRR